MVTRRPPEEALGTEHPRRGVQEVLPDVEVPDGYLDGPGEGELEGRIALGLKHRPLRRVGRREDQPRFGHGGVEIALVDLLRLPYPR